MYLWQEHPYDVSVCAQQQRAGNAIDVKLAVTAHIVSHHDGEKMTAGLRGHQGNTARHGTVRIPKSYQIPESGCTVTFTLMVSASPLRNPLPDALSDRNTPLLCVS